MRQPLFAEPAGRAGDWWEPLSIPAAEIRGALHSEAEQRRLPIDLLAALLIEHALVENDIAACALDGRRARAVLTAAADAKPTLGPGCLHTNYVRMFGTGERGYESESDVQLADRDLVLPLRLHEAARTITLREVGDGAALDEAIAWEIAAASSGQFMREWALRLLLAAFAA